jgi:hypothetical protein
MYKNENTSKQAGFHLSTKDDMKYIQIASSAMKVLFVNYI